MQSLLPHRLTQGLALSVQVLATWASRRAGLHRRGFAVVAAALLSPLITVGCGDSTVIAPGQGGLVRVTINGLAAGLPSAGTATITREGLDDPIVITLPGDSSGVALVPIGTYTVDYDPPTGYTMAPGSSDQIEVTVGLNEVSEVNFAVIGEIGTLQIVVDGVDAGGTSGGAVDVERTDVEGYTPFSILIPNTGTASAPVASGVYRVTYAPPTGHQLAAGQTNPRSVTVETGQTGTATFSVEFLSGTLEVTVVGLRSGAPSGGSVRAQRTDLGGQPAINYVVPASGNLSQTVGAGTYSVTYTPPSGHQLSAGETNPQNATVPTNGVGSVSFDVDQVAIPGGVVFHSDWNTATGATINALTDGGTWAIQTTLSASDVIRSTGLNFPTTNVLRVASDGSSGSEILQSTNIPIPNVGESLYYRWYWRYVAPSGWQGTHSIQDGPNQGSLNWSFDQGPRSATTHRAGIFVNGNTNPSPLNGWGDGLTHDNGNTYRWEVQIHRITTGTFQAHVRVYVVQGGGIANGGTETLILTDPDFDAAGTGLTLADNPEHDFTQVENLSGLRVGVNGDSGITSYQIHSYQGGFCIRTDDWCGPYAGGI